MLCMKSAYVASSSPLANLNQSQATLRKKNIEKIAIKTVRVGRPSNLYMYTN